MTSDSFFLVNTACTLLAFALLVRLWRRQRWLFVKPSLLILAVSVLLFQVPLVIGSDVIYAALPRPGEVALLVHGYLLGGLLLAPFGFRSAAWDTWQGITAASLDDLRSSIQPLTLIAVVMVAAYLAFVPFTQTGLYSLLSGDDPEAFSLARETSVKLVTSSIPRYALMLLAASVGPILTGLCTLDLVQHWTTNSWARRSAQVLLLLAIWSACMLSGAKGILVFQVMTGFVALAFYRKLQLSLVGFAAATVAILLPAVLITVLMSSPDLDVATNSTGAVQATAARSLVVPFMVDIWYVDYTQQGGGPAGIAALRPLAVLFDKPYFDLPNFIGLTYAPGFYGHDVIGSISATGGYLFYFYAVFGIDSLGLSIFLLLASDVVMLLTRRIPGGLGLAVLAAMLVSAQKFAQSDYTTVWLTHGFGVIPLIGVFLVRQRRSAAVGDLHGN